jgi:hypothetical protein
VDATLFQVKRLMPHWVNEDVMALVAMSGPISIADIDWRRLRVRFVPIADMQFRLISQSWWYHDCIPAKYNITPTAQQPARVGIIPTLKRKIAIAAAIESTRAQGSTLASFGASKLSRNARTGIVSWKTVWIAN